jgi:hypothetical protein
MGRDHILIAFLGAFAILQKATIDIVMFICLSVRIEQLGSRWSYFHEIWYFDIFPKIYREKRSFIEIWQEYRTFYVETYLYLRNISLKVFQTKLVEKFKTLILCSITFFRKSCLLWNNVEKYGIARQATDDIIQHMRFACWITKGTDTPSEYIIFLSFYGNNG